MPSWCVSIPQRLILLPKTVFSHFPDMPVIKSESDYGDVITVKLHSVPKLFFAYSQTRCSADPTEHNQSEGEKLLKQIQTRCAFAVKNRKTIEPKLL